MSAGKGSLLRFLPRRPLTTTKSRFEARQSAIQIVTDGLEWTAGDAYIVADEYLHLLTDLERAEAEAIRGKS